MRGQRYVALLRGVNVGKAKRLAMADLKALYESLGATEVSTLLNSGNVVFTAPAKAPKDLARVLEEQTAAKLGVSSWVALVSAEEFAAILALSPLSRLATDPSRLLVGVLRSLDDRPRLEALASQAGPGVSFELGTAEAARACYLWCPDGISKSAFAEVLLGNMKNCLTTRNWSTMEKIRAVF